jgi:uroporphyrinogen-III synthase
MKHLKKFEELNADTYRSAADKLRTNHPDRAKSLYDYADEKSDGSERYYVYTGGKFSDYYFEIKSIEDGKVTFIDSNNYEMVFVPEGESLIWAENQRRDKRALLFTNRKDARRFMKELGDYKGFENVKINNLYKS